MEKQGGVIPLQNNTITNCDNLDIEIKEEVANIENSADADDALSYSIIIKSLPPNIAKTDQKPEYRCITCNKSFMHSSSLKRHQSSRHNDGAVFKCEICKRIFCLEYNFKRHQLTHGQKDQAVDEMAFQNDKTFKYGISHRSFVTEKPHLHHSSSEPLFKCQICEKTYTQEAGLKQHASMHSEYYEYNCNICSKQFIRLMDLIEHRKDHENQNNGNNVNYEWSEQETCALINLFKQKRELWDPSDWNYMNKQIKPLAWQGIAISLNKTTHEVETKIWSLISQYQIEENLRQINGNDYESKWFAFKLFSFLKDRNKLVRSNPENFSAKQNESTPDSYQSGEIHNLRDMDSPLNLEIAKKQNVNFRSQNVTETLADHNTYQINYINAPSQMCQQVSEFNGNQKQIYYVTNSIDIATHLQADNSNVTFTNNKIFEQTNSRNNGNVDIHNHNYSNKGVNDLDMNDLLRKLYNKISRDEYDIYSEIVACGIRNLKTEYAKSTVKYHINNILYQAELGHYDQPYPIEENLKDNFVNGVQESIAPQDVSTVGELENVINHL